MTDQVNHPVHYTSCGAACSKCGTRVEAIDVTEAFNFNLGNAIKYVWRAELKGKTEQDLQKAIWYINREIERRRKENGKANENDTETLAQVELREGNNND